MLYLPLHLIQSALGQKVEAKPVESLHQERSQDRAAMHGREGEVVILYPGDRVRDGQRVKP
ncbi:MAG: hypothetical protein AAB466_05795, partial [Verrucomicrobiota bacterium]